MARWVDKESLKAVQQRSSVGNNLLDADRVNLLVLKTAQARAGKVDEELNKTSHLEATGKVLFSCTYTVVNAVQDYIRDAELRGVNGHIMLTLTIKAHIIPN